jgi:hypothetical protein
VTELREAQAVISRIQELCDRAPGMYEDIRAAIEGNQP